MIQIASTTELGKDPSRLGGELHTSALRGGSILRVDGISEKIPIIFPLLTGVLTFLINWYLGISTSEVLNRMMAKVTHLERKRHQPSGGGFGLVAVIKERKVQVSRTLEAPNR